MGDFPIVTLGPSLLMMQSCLNDVKLAMFISNHLASAIGMV